MNHLTLNIYVEKHNEKYFQTTRHDVIEILYLVYIRVKYLKGKYSLVYDYNLFYAIYM